MGSVLNKTSDPVDYRLSVHTPDFDPTFWFINPDVSQVEKVPTKYWARPLTDPVTEMTQVEKDAVDQAEKDAITQEARDTGSSAAEANSGVGTQNRGLVETFNKRDNYSINRIEELQATLTNMKNSTGAADNMRAEIPDTWLPTATRDRPTAIADYQNTIETGQVDAPQGGESVGRRG